MNEQTVFFLFFEKFLSLFSELISVVFASNFFIIIRFPVIVLISCFLITYIIKLFRR